MSHRFARYIAQILVLLASVLPTMGLGIAEGADAVLRSVTPSSARPGDELVIGGENVLSPHSGTIYSTIRYGTATDVIRGDLGSSDWSNTRVRARLPADIGPGTYWLAVYRNGVLSSNRLNFTVALVARGAPITTPVPVAVPSVAAARVVDGPDCSGHSVIRLSGGPFRLGTDSASWGSYTWALGRTGVEVSVEGGRGAIDFWNALISRVTVLSERELEVHIARCFVIQKRPRIRAILPVGTGTPTNWVDVRR